MAGWKLKNKTADQIVGALSSFSLLFLCSHSFSHNFRGQPIRPGSCSPQGRAWHWQISLGGKKVMPKKKSLGVFFAFLLAIVDFQPPTHPTAMPEDKGEPSSEVPPNQFPPFNYFFPRFLSKPSTGTTIIATGQKKKAPAKNSWFVLFQSLPKAFSLLLPWIPVLVRRRKGNCLRHPKMKLIKNTFCWARLVLEHVCPPSSRRRCHCMPACTPIIKYALGLHIMIDLFSHSRFLHCKIFPEKHGIFTPVLLFFRHIKWMLTLILNSVMYATALT